MFLASLSNPSNNWLSNLSLDPGDEMALYVYSFYFSTTTILTVGYGDLSPKNVTEVVVVVLIQIFGRLWLTQA